MWECQSHLVDLDEHSDTLFSFAFQYPVQSVSLILRGGSPQVQFWTQPPVTDPDCAGSLLKYFGQGPEVVHSIDVPFDVVALPLRGEALIAMTVQYFLPDPVGLSLVIFIVSMIWIVSVLERPDQ